MRYSSERKYRKKNFLSLPRFTRLQAHAEYKITI